MRLQPLFGVSKSLLPVLALSLVPLLLSGCSGGSDGSNGTSAGTVSGTVKNSISGSAVSGASVTTSPAVQGMPAVTTDANGSYSMNMPIGSYTLTFKKSNFTTQTKSIVVVAGQTDTYTISLVPSAGAAVNAGATKTGQAFGASVPLSATLEVYDPSITGTPTWAWTQVSGPAATITGGTTASPTVTLASRSSYKAYLVQTGAAQQSTWPTFASDKMVPLERFMIQAINPLSLDEGATATFKAEATIGSQKFSSTVDVEVTLQFVRQSGIRNVPIGQPVLLRGKTQSSYSWSLTTTPSGSTATVNDASSQNPDFTPDLAGKYTIKESTSGASLDIYAGTWLGVIMPDGNPDSACTTCHRDGGAAPDKFTAWLASGHAGIMTQNITNPAGSWAFTGDDPCAKCHTVGFNTVTASVNNNGWDQVAAAEGFKFTQGASAWTDTLKNYPKTARLSNIQCENCHGPQTSNGHSAGTPRVSISSNVCGYCHGETLRHARFQQWAESGHGNFTFPLRLGFADPPASGSASGETNFTGQSVKLLRGGCSGCHTGQGSLQLQKQLQGGSGRVAGSRTLDDTSLKALLGTAYVAEVYTTGPRAGQGTGNYRADTTFSSALSMDNVEPQTCVVCHSPHAQGTTAYEPNTATVRITDSTPLLAGGFMATGVGRGAMCVVCHNSRNGEPRTAEIPPVYGSPTLHEDGDVNWGDRVGKFVSAAGTTYPIYSTPHAPSQGDTLMGRNAYYVTGARSKHSFLADTCATCHMEMTDPPAKYSYNLMGTNHLFNASTTICTKCHGAFDGGTIEASFDAARDELKEEIGKAVYRLKNGVNPPAGTTIVMTIGSTPRISINGATAVNLQAKNSASSEPIAGGYLDGVAGTTAGSFGYHPDLAKAIWNYALVTNDGSDGIHNPSFVFGVLQATTAKMKSL